MNREKERHKDKRQAQLLAPLQAQLSPKGKSPKVPVRNCHLCGKPSHWKPDCKVKPKTPCPKCKEHGHWACNCSESCRGHGPEPFMTLD